MEIVNNLLPALENLGIFGYWVVFFVAFLESLAFVGSLVPGSTVVIFAGVLAARGYFDVGDLIFFAALGAILGDSVSYYLGTKGTRFFRHENKFLKLAHLERGKLFFKKHGPKSIFFGRFIGPIRPIVPFIAGLSAMNRRAFLFWNVLGGGLWAFIHIFIGYSFSGVLHSIETWISRTGLIILGGVAITVALWFLVKKIPAVLSFCAGWWILLRNAISSNAHIARMIKHYPHFFEFLHARFIKKDFSGLPLTTLSILFIYTLALFFGVVQDIILSDMIVATDLRLANLLFAVRDSGLTKFSLWVTVLGTWQVVLCFALVASALLWLWRKYNYIVPLWIVIIGSEAMNFFGKIALHRPRPEIAFYAEKSFSFPSGHATIAVAFYGFIAYILWRQNHLNWKRKTNILFLALTLVAGIGFSRLYLGVHFLSDVWGGYLLGGLWLIIGISVSEWLLAKKEWRHTPSVVPTHTKIISASLIALAMMLYAVFGLLYKPTHSVFQNDESGRVVISDIFDGFIEQKLPLLTESLLGKKQMPVNLVIVANNNSHLEETMARAGWVSADDINLTSLATLSKATFLNEYYYQAPLTPLFWNSMPHDIGFKKRVIPGNSQKPYSVRFWISNLETEEGQRVYVGIVNGGTKKGKEWSTDQTFSIARDRILADLNMAQLVSSIKEKSFAVIVLKDLENSRD